MMWLFLHPTNVWRHRMTKDFNEINQSCCVRWFKNDVWSSNAAQRGPQEHAISKNQQNKWIPTKEKELSRKRDERLNEATKITTPTQAKITIVIRQWMPSSMWFLMRTPTTTLAWDSEVDHILTLTNIWESTTNNK